MPYKIEVDETAKILLNHSRLWRSPNTGALINVETCTEGRLRSAIRSCRYKNRDGEYQILGGEYFKKKLRKILKRRFPR